MKIVEINENTNTTTRLTTRKPQDSSVMEFACCLMVCAFCFATLLFAIAIILIGIGSSCLNQKQYDLCGSETGAGAILGVGLVIFLIPAGVIVCLCSSKK